VGLVTALCLNRNTKCRKFASKDVCSFGTKMLVNGDNSKWNFGVVDHGWQTIQIDAAGDCIRYLVKLNSEEIAIRLSDCCQSLPVLSMSSSLSACAGPYRAFPCSSTKRSLSFRCVLSRLPKLVYLQRLFRKNQLSASLTPDVHKKTKWQDWRQPIPLHDQILHSHFLKYWFNYSTEVTNFWVVKICKQFSRFHLNTTLKQTISWRSN